MHLMQNALNANEGIDLGALTLKGSSGALERELAFVASQNDVVELLIGASRIEQCDFEVELDTKGPLALMPHLGAMRRALTLVRADGIVKAERGDASAATESFAAAFRMARHVRDDTTLIGTLVGMAGFNLVALEVNAGLDRAVFREQDKATLRQALDRFEGEDPFGTRRALRGERRVFIEWLRREYAKGERPSKDWLEFFTLASNEQRHPGSVKLLKAAIERGDSLEPYFIMLDLFYEECEQAWEQPDAASRLQQIVDRVDNGAFGPIAPVVVPNLTQIHQKDQEAITALNSLRARL